MDRSKGIAESRAIAARRTEPSPCSDPCTGTTDRRSVAQNWLLCAQPATLGARNATPREVSGARARRLPRRADRTAVRHPSTSRDRSWCFQRRTTSNSMRIRSRADRYGPSPDRGGVLWRRVPGRRGSTMRRRSCGSEVYSCCRLSQMWRSYNSYVPASLAGINGFAVNPADPQMESIANGFSRSCGWFAKSAWSLSAIGVTRRQE